MIQLAKDLFITSQNLIHTAKDVKNREIVEKFASVLKTEDSRVATKSIPVIDNEKSAFIENPISPEQRISGNRESSISDFVEESVSTDGELYLVENEDETGVDADECIDVCIYMNAPIVAESNANDNTGLVDSLINNQDNEIDKVDYLSDVTKFESYRALSSSQDASDKNLSDLSALYDLEADKDQSYIDGDSQFIIKKDTSEKSGVSFDSISNEMASLSEDNESHAAEVKLRESVNTELEKDNSVKPNTDESNSTKVPLLVNEENIQKFDELNESDHQDNAGFNPQIVKKAEKRNSKVSTADDSPKTEEDNAEPVDAQAVDFVHKLAKEEKVTQNNNPQRVENKVHLDGRDKEDSDRVDLSRVEKMPQIDYLRADDDSDKDIVVNQREFQNFVHKISEQNSLLNSDPTRHILKSEQMSLINKGRLAFSESIENVVKFIRTGNLTKAVLIVDPPALGRVNIEIVSTDNGIEAVIKVSNEHIRMLIQDNSVQLKQSLERIGVNLTEFSVDIQQDGARSRNQSFNNRPRKSARMGTPEGESKAEKIEIFRVDLRKGLLHWIA